MGLHLPRGCCHGTQVAVLYLQRPRRGRCTPHTWILALVVAVSPWPSVIVRVATHDTPVLRAVLIVRPAAAPVVIVKGSPVTLTGARPVQSRVHARKQLPGVLGQRLLEA